MSSISDTSERFRTVQAHQVQIPSKGSERFRRLRTIPNYPELSRTIPNYSELSRTNSN